VFCCLYCRIHKLAFSLHLLNLKVLYFCLTSRHALGSIITVSIDKSIKMNKLFIIIVTITILLTSCRSEVFMKPPLDEPSDDANIKLAEAASSVSESMHEMAQVEKFTSPPLKNNIVTIPNTHNLQVRASVDWSGPIKEVTARVAKAGHFRLRILGKEPAVPVLVSLAVKDESLAEILRNIDYQAGKKAYIHVYPMTQIVELRYAKIYA
jgi:defect-in-organelle-trafficking protein DotD